MDRVQVEPHTYEGRRRDDIRLPGSAVRGAKAVDCYNKVYSLMAANTPSTTTRKPQETSTLQHAADQCDKYLSNVAKAADGRRPWVVGGFKLMVCSLSGLMEKETAK